MRKVVVLGWYGHRNFGDEVILKGLLQLFKDWHVMVMSSDCTGTYPMIDFDTVNECDLFVLGGGELINANNLFMLSPLKIPPSFYRLYAHTPFAHKSWVSRIKIPKIILGCGVNAKGPSELRTNVIKDLEQFDFIGLRDNVAVSILKSFPQLKSKVHLFYDLGFAIDTNGLSWKHSKNRAVVIPTDRFTRSDRGVTECEVAIKSREWLKEKLKPYEKTVFLAFGEQDNNDLETCETLAFYCTNKSEIIKASQHSLEEILNLIGDSQITLPYRLHGLILSFLTGTRYEFYPYHWKLQRVHDTIKGLDLEEIKQKQKAILEATGFFLQSK